MKIRQAHASGSLDLENLAVSQQLAVYVNVYVLSRRFGELDDRVLLELENLPDHHRPAAQLDGDPDRDIEKPPDFFQSLLKHGSLGWLGTLVHTLPLFVRRRPLGRDRPQALELNHEFDYVDVGDLCLR